MYAALASRWSALLSRAERRLPALTRLKRAEPLPILLHRRRIYVVPSRFGLFLTLILLVMLVGALNYNNNPAMLLTCLLGAATYQSVFSGFRMLNRVELHSVQTQPCRAGETLQIQLFFRSDAATKHNLRLRMENAAPEDAGEEIVFDIPEGSTQAVETRLPAPRRGWQPIGRVRVWTEYPFGLFHLWSWLHPDYRALIYPRAELNVPPLPAGGSHSQNRASRLQDDEIGLLRDYHASDARRMIAWKASARHDRLLVKEFERRQGEEVVLDWQALQGLDQEARISRLAAWVDRAEAAQMPYQLRLPETSLGPGVGSEHRHACLRELALLPVLSP